MASQTLRSEFASQLTKGKESETEKKWCAGSCLLLPASILLEFKRLYRRRYLNAKVFKGNPLQTIEEAAEIPPLLEGNDPPPKSQASEVDVQNAMNLAVNENEDLGAFSSEDFDSDEDYPDDNSGDEEGDEHLVSEWGSEENLMTAQSSERLGTETCSLSPSVSLICQFEASIKEEAAQRIQRWYKTKKARQRFLVKKTAVVQIQRWYRDRLKFMLDNR